MRIHLEHICHPQAIERRMQRRNVLTILSGYNRLGEGSLEQPALLYPGRIECGDNALEMRKELCHHFLFAPGEERIIHWTIVAQVDEVSSTILSRRTEVGMLEEAREGIAWVTNVDPVAIGQLVIEGKNETMSAVCLPPVVFDTLVLWQSRNETTGEPRG